MAQSAAWNSGLCSCMEDFGSCFCGICCLPCLYGNNVEKHRGSGMCGPCWLYTLCGFFACFFAGSFRSEVRNKYNLSEEPCSDCLVHFFCSPCAVCQEARELKFRVQ